MRRHARRGPAERRQLRRTLRRLRLGLKVKASIGPRGRQHRVPAWMLHFYLPQTVPLTSGQQVQPYGCRSIEFDAAR